MDDFFAGEGRVLGALLNVPEELQHLIRDKDRRHAVTIATHVGVDGPGLLRQAIGDADNRKATDVAVPTPLPAPRG